MVTSPAVDLYVYAANIVDRYPDRDGDGTYDGDTLTIDQDFGCGLGRTTVGVRFALVDTPELRGRHSRFWRALIEEGFVTEPEVDAIADNAAGFIEAACPDGSPVLVRTHRDRNGKYGRLVAEVYAPAARVPDGGVFPGLDEEFRPDLDWEEFSAPVLEHQGVEWLNLNYELARLGLALRAWG